MTGLKEFRDMSRAGINVGQATHLSCFGSMQAAAVNVRNGLENFVV